MGIRQFHNSIAIVGIAYRSKLQVFDLGSSADATWRSRLAAAPSSGQTVAAPAGSTAPLAPQLQAAVDKMLVPDQGLQSDDECGHWQSPPYATAQPLIVLLCQDEPALPY